MSGKFTANKINALCVFFESGPLGMPSDEKLSNNIVIYGAFGNFVETGVSSRYNFSFRYIYTSPSNDVRYVCVQTRTES